MKHIKFKTKWSTLFFCALLFIIPFFFVNADETDKVINEDLLPPPEIPGHESESKNASTTPFNTVNQNANLEFYKKGEPGICTDYYTFGSIDINLAADTKNYQAGDPVLIRGKIKNNNPYPMIGLDIKARLVKDIPEPEYFRSEIITLDDLNIVENVTIPANGEYEVSYSLPLPFNAPSGEYKVFFYAVEQDRFNMSGLSFTNDIVGSYISFSVDGNIPDHVYLDQTKILVGNQEHNVMAFMTQHPKDSDVPVTIPLYNPHNTPIAMRVTYDLYSWDSANPKNKIGSRSEEVIVPAKSETVLKYVIQKTENPVYYLAITAEPSSSDTDKSVHSEKTISNIRLIVQDIAKPRLNFITTNTYPLKKGQESVLATCFHNTSTYQDGSNSKIVTILKDSRGREITRTVFDGIFSSDIQAIISKIKPRKDIYDYTIESTLYDSKGDIVDKVEKKYSCTDISPASCPTKNTLLSTIISAGILVLIIAILVIVKIKRKTINIEHV